MEFILAKLFVNNGAILPPLDKNHHISILTLTLTCRNGNADTHNVTARKTRFRTPLKWDSTTPWWPKRLDICVFFWSAW